MAVRDSWSRHPVDVLVRDLDLVERWLSEAIAGRFEILDQHRCLVRGPNYILAGELALGESRLRGNSRARKSPMHWPRQRHGTGTDARACP